MKDSLQKTTYRFRKRCLPLDVCVKTRGALLAVILLLALFVAPQMRGQGLTGSIAGTVVGPSGVPVSGASVTIREATTNAVRNVKTSDAGTYTVPQLTPGVYSVRVEMEGFETFEKANITLAIDQTAQINAKLDIGSTEQTISVTSESPVIQTESSSVGLVVDSPTIKNTPLNGHLSILGLLNLVPGTQDVAAQDQVPVRGVTLAFGTNQRNSYGDAGFTFDGVTNMEVMLQRGQSEVPPLDTISQFKVITNGAPAEFNQPNQVIVVSQGGANQFHGEALEFNRGKGTSAKEYYGGGQQRAPYQRNEYGGNLSGPIVVPHLYNGHDRSFFAFGYEGFHLTQSVSVNSEQPTDLMRQGIFTEFSTPIINPATGSPFPNNTINVPLNQVDVQLQNLLFPHATQQTQGVNTFELIPHVTDVNRYFTRIDHKINENNQLRFSMMMAYYGPFADVGTSSLAGGVARDGEHNNIFVLGWTHAFSPTLLLDSYVSYMHLRLYRDAQNYKTDFASIIPGLAPQRLEGAPQLTITNITGVSESGSANLEQTYQGNTSLTKVLARHTIKGGFSYLYDNGWQDNAESPARGAYSFNGHYTGNAYADFLLGLPYGSSYATEQSTPGDFVTRYLSSQYGMYVQDDFKPFSKLTLNYGVRYDLQAFGDNPYNGASLFVPSVGKVVVFGNHYPASTIQAYVPDTVLSSTVGLPEHIWSYLGLASKNVAPRFGFAYQLRHDTVLRGAFGVFFNLIPSSYIDGAFTNLPFVSTISYSQPATGEAAITMDAPFSGTGAYGANPSVIAQHSTATPYTEQYNLALEHQFARGLDLRIGYIGQRTIHQNNFGGPGNTQADINLPSPAPGSVQARRPYQPFSTISENFAPLFHTTANSLQVGVHKQFSHGFMVNAEYQWIRVLGVENFENPANIGDSYGNISSLTPQTLSVSYVYALPFGKGRPFLKTAAPVVEKILGGWEIAGFSQFQSGQPFSVTYTAPGNPTGLVSGRANRVPGVALYPHDKTKAEWFNTAAFTTPPYYTYGTSGYNMLWGPHYQDWDMNLMKNIGWGERYNVQLRVDAFNIFNHPNFSVPSAAITNPSSFGKITSAVGESRKMEFAAKFTF